MEHNDQNNNTNFLDDCSSLSFVYPTERRDPSLVLEELGTLLEVCNTCKNNLSKNIDSFRETVSRRIGTLREQYRSSCYDYILKNGDTQSLNGLIRVLGETMSDVFAGDGQCSCEVHDQVSDFGSSLCDKLQRRLNRASCATTCLKEYVAEIENCLEVNKHAIPLEVFTMLFKIKGIVDDVSSLSQKVGSTQKELSISNDLAALMRCLGELQVPMCPCKQHDTAIENSLECNPCYTDLADSNANEDILVFESAIDSNTKNCSLGPSLSLSHLGSVETNECLIREDSSLQNLEFSVENSEQDTMESSKEYALCSRCQTPQKCLEPTERYARDSKKYKKSQISAKNLEPGEVYFNGHRSRSQNSNNRRGYEKEARFSRFSKSPISRECRNPEETFTKGYKPSAHYTRPQKCEDYFGRKEARRNVSKHHSRYSSSRNSDECLDSEEPYLDSSKPYVQKRRSRNSKKYLEPEECYQKEQEYKSENSVKFSDAEPISSKQSRKHSRSRNPRKMESKEAFTEGSKQCVEEARYTSDCDIEPEVSRMKSSKRSVKRSRFDVSPKNFSEQEESILETCPLPKETRVRNSKFTRSHAFKDSSESEDCFVKNFKSQIEKCISRLSEENLEPEECYTESSKQTVPFRYQYSSKTSKSSETEECLEDSSTKSSSRRQVSIKNIDPQKSFMKGLRQSMQGECLEEESYTKALKQCVPYSRSQTSKEFTELERSYPKGLKTYIKQESISEESEILEPEECYMKSSKKIVQYTRTQASNECPGMEANSTKKSKKVSESKQISGKRPKQCIEISGSENQKEFFMKTECFESTESSVKSSLKPELPYISGFEECEEDKVSPEDSKLSGFVDCEADKTSREDPKLSGFVECEADKISREDPKLSGFMDCEADKTSREDPKLSGFVECESDKTSREDPKLSEFVDCEADKTSRQDPKLSGFVECEADKSHKTSREDPKLSGFVDCEADKTSREDPKLSGFVECEAGKTSREDTKMSGFVECETDKISQGDSYAKKLKENTKPCLKESSTQIPEVCLEPTKYSVKNSDRTGHPTIQEECFENSNKQTTEQFKQDRSGIQSHEGSEKYSKSITLKSLDSKVCQRTCGTQVSFDNCIPEDCYTKDSKPSDELSRYRYSKNWLESVKAGTKSVECSEETDRNLKSGRLKDLDSKVCQRTCGTQVSFDNCISEDLYAKDFKPIDGDSRYRHLKKWLEPEKAVTKSSRQGVEGSEGRERNLKSRRLKNLDPNVCQRTCGTQVSFDNCISEDRYTKDFKPIDGDSRYRQLKNWEPERAVTKISRQGSGRLKNFDSKVCQRTCGTQVFIKNIMPEDCYNEQDSRYRRSIDCLEPEYGYPKRSRQGMEGSPESKKISNSGRVKSLETKIAQRTCGTQVSVRNAMAEDCYTKDSRQRQQYSRYEQLSPNCFEPSEVHSRSKTHRKSLEKTPYYRRNSTSDNYLDSSQSRRGIPQDNYDTDMSSEGPCVYGFVECEADQISTEGPSEEYSGSETPKFDKMQKSKSPRKSSLKGNREDKTFPENASESGFGEYDEESGPPSVKFSNLQRPPSRSFEPRKSSLKRREVEEEKISPEKPGIPELEEYEQNAKSPRKSSLKEDNKISLDDARESGFVENGEESGPESVTFSQVRRPSRNSIEIRKSSLRRKEVEEDNMEYEEDSGSQIVKFAEMQSSKRNSIEIRKASLKRKEIEDDKMSPEDPGAFEFAEYEEESETQSVKFSQMQRKFSQKRKEGEENKMPQEVPKVSGLDESQEDSETPKMERGKTNSTAFRKPSLKQKEGAGNKMSPEDVNALGFGKYEEDSEKGKTKGKQDEQEEDSETPSEKSLKMQKGKTKPKEVEDEQEEDSKSAKFSKLEKGKTKQKEDEEVSKTPSEKSLKKQKGKAKQKESKDEPEVSETQSEKSLKTKKGKAKRKESKDEQEKDSETPSEKSLKIQKGKAKQKEDEENKMSPEDASTTGSDEYELDSETQSLKRGKTDPSLKGKDYDDDEEILLEDHDLSDYDEYVERSGSHSGKGQKMQRGKPKGFDYRKSAKKGKDFPSGSQEDTGESACIQETSGACSRNVSALYLFLLLSLSTLAFIYWFFGEDIACYLTGVKKSSPTTSSPTVVNYRHYSAPPF